MKQRFQRKPDSGNICSGRIPKKKRTRGLLFLLILFLFFLPLGLSGCGDGSAAAKAEGEQDGNLSKDNTLHIVATIFPEYDWVREVLGSETVDTELTLLSGAGVDLHNFQPTVADIVKVSDCDLFLYVGGESDVWAEDALKEATNKDMVVINLMELLGDDAKEEEEGDDGPEYDEHVWLSLQNAEIFCQAIADALCDLRPDRSEQYEANASSYIKKLSELDEKYRAICDAAPRKTLLFGDRFPFRYLAEDYGLTCYAAFYGCSAESEADFETIVSLAEKVDELSLQNVMIIETSDGKIAETVVRNTKEKNQQILTMDSMQAVTAEDIENGTTYLSIAQKNLTVLEEALY